MVITVLQFVLALYLMCIIIKDFSARKSFKECFSGTVTNTIFVKIHVIKFPFSYLSLLVMMKLSV
jgi:hypothetical protein